MKRWKGSGIHMEGQNLEGTEFLPFLGRGEEMRRIPSARRRDEISKARPLAGDSFAFPGPEGKRWLRAAGWRDMGSGQGDGSRAFATAQTASQAGKGRLGRASTQQRRQLLAGTALPREPSKSPGMVRGDSGCPKGSPEK